MEVSWTSSSNLFCIFITIIWTGKVTMETDRHFASGPKRFDGDQILRIQVPSKTVWEKVMGILEKHIPAQEIDIWAEPNKITYSADVHIPAVYLQEVTSELRSKQSHIKYTVLMDNLQNAIDREVYSLKHRRKRFLDHLDNSIVGTYPTLGQINDWLIALEYRYPGKVRRISIGTTYEGRTMYVLQLGSDLSEKKPSVWMDSTLHAREWVAPAVSIYIIDQLLTNSFLKDYMDNLHWYFLIIANPDGYVYSHQYYRLWRLNRVPVSDICYGVDLNRNWNYQWGGENASPNPCSDIYRGPAPESENEVINMRDFILSRNDTIKAYISLHSYTQNWFTRWAYTNTSYPEDHDELLELSERAVKAIQSVHGKHYGVGNAAMLLYPFSGGSPDWARGVAGIKYPFLIELRDQGVYGFLLPTEEIIPTAEEAWKGITVLIDHVIEKYILKTTSSPNSLHSSTINDDIPLYTQQTEKRAFVQDEVTDPSKKYTAPAVHSCSSCFYVQNSVIFIFCILQSVFHYYS